MKTQQFSVEEYATDHTCKKIIFLQLASSSKLQEQSQGAAERFSRLDFRKSTVTLCLCFLHCMSFGQRLGCNLMPYSIITKMDFTDTKYPSEAPQPASPSAVIDETNGYDNNFQKPSAFPSQQRMAQQDSTKQNVTALHSVQGTRCARV